jgi:hypothetical protein
LYFKSRAAEALSEEECGAAKPVIIWDLEDDPDGNYWHIAVEGHGVTAEEVEEVLSDPANETVPSHSSGNPATFGWTSTGKHLIVVWEHVDDDPLTAYPITAYEVPPRRRQP